MNIELKEVILSYNEYLGNIPNGLLYIVEKLREDNIQDAFLTIKDFSEGMLWLSEANELLRKNGLNVDLSIEKIQEFLIEVNEGLEKQDFVLVADMFEYEISPFFLNAKLVEEYIQ